VAMEHADAPLTIGRSVSKDLIFTLPPPLDGVEVAMRNIRTRAVLVTKPGKQRVSATRPDSAGNDGDAEL
jgi:hypothetical protein